MKRIGIIGATGYSGIELIRILLQHPEIYIQSLYSSSAEGRSLAEFFPHLQSADLPMLQGIQPEKIAQENDVVFLATPAGVSAEITPVLIKGEVKIIDLSGDLRLRSPEAYQEWYKKSPAAKEVLQQAVYGLPEWNKSKVREASVVANPGCYPTATLLSLLPLLQTEWIKPDSIIVDAKSGVSGAGRGASLGVHYSELNDSFHAYKVGQHQHTPEIEQGILQMTKKEIAIQFTPHLVPMTRGILTTSYIQIDKSKDVGFTVEGLQKLYEHAYQNAPFVRVRPFGSYPRTKEVLGTNYCDIALHFDERTGRIIILSVIDNMVKGAAGQAIQNMNLLFGFEETLGLPKHALYP
ncbi:N-acetyl-gamma-glutamyl-phosphate reductase [Brevibacillus laterosporus]|uniref:N-acetyl-gamma-glutamyl-phosphate reductase n=1 Tax=Brevibacillus laterosporus TaxID=1465 RepID=UPI000BC5A4E1|nr:N-acetyl-gamma-glutamyl-phosphate reductase [Brevibacillus laterosporus]PCN45478.1 N-acetyl-gamma-glutamyl-phosphate reductase [Brevibacillus laterosporus]